MKLLTPLWFWLLSGLVFAQAPSGDGATQGPVINEALETELKAMRESDQLYRGKIVELQQAPEANAAELREVWKKQTEIDVRNMRRLEEIIAQYGWPGKSLVGEKGGSGAAFLVLQHATHEDRRKYLPLLREAVLKGDAKPQNLALVEDRFLLAEGKKQIYGSQVQRDEFDGFVEWVPSPIEDEANVDERRKSIGLPPLADYLQGFADRQGGAVPAKWRKTVAGAAASTVKTSEKEEAAMVAREQLRAKYAPLRAELEAMEDAYQFQSKKAFELKKVHGANSAESTDAIKMLEEVKAGNLKRLEEIVAESGWPQKSKVGAKAVRAAFNTVLSSKPEVHRKYLPLLREASGKGDVTASRLAVLEDRVLQEEGKKQMYGTQFQRNSNRELEPGPIEDEARVDELRKQVGLEPLADALRSHAELNGGTVAEKWRKQTSAGAVKQDGQEASDAALEQKRAKYTALRAELEEMMIADQLYRGKMAELGKVHGANSSEVTEAKKKQEEIDVRNLRRLEEIIAEIGWPAKSLIGERAAGAAFFVIQHAKHEDRKKYLPLVREAAARGDVKASRLALMEDRFLLGEGKKQLYGTQVQQNAQGEWEPCPTEDEATVDERRKQIGLQPLAEYLQTFADESGGTVAEKWRKQPTKDAKPMVKAEEKKAAETSR